jgi:hypothetical protein
MKLEDVKIEMKVVPHSKSIGSLGLENSSNWLNVKETDTPYLYVSYYSHKRCVLSTHPSDFEGDGDYFRAEDFELYIEPSAIPNDKPLDGNKYPSNTHFPFITRDKYAGLDPEVCRALVAGLYVKVRAWNDNEKEVEGWLVDYHAHDPDDKLSSDGWALVSRGLSTESYTHFVLEYTTQKKKEYYIGRWGAFWDNDEPSNSWKSSKLAKIRYDYIYPFENEEGEYWCHFATTLDGSPLPFNRADWGDNVIIF